MQLEVCADELWVLASALLPVDVRVPQDLSGCRARLEEFAFLHHPAAARRADLMLGDHPPFRIALTSLDGHSICTRSAHGDLIADLRLGERLLHRTLEILAPHRALSLLRTDLDEVRHRFVRIEPIGLPAMIDQLADDEVTRTPTSGSL